MRVFHTLDAGPIPAVRKTQKTKNTKSGDVRVVKEADSRPAAKAHGFEPHSPQKSLILLYKKYLVEEEVFLLTGLAQSVERRPFTKVIFRMRAECRGFEPRNR